MALTLVHSAIEDAYRVKPKRVNPEHERALKRLAIRQERDSAIAVAEFPKEVAEIREYMPGWMPGQIIK